jgi:hypothetical protein
MIKAIIFDIGEVITFSAGSEEKYTNAAADLGFNSITYRVNKQLFEELEDLDTIFK